MAGSNPQDKKPSPVLKKQAVIAITVCFLCGATAEQILRFRQQGLIFRFV